MKVNIPFFRHDLGEAELASLAEAFKNPILTTGDLVGEFQDRFAQMLGCKHALAVTSCTGAMHMTLLALGIGPGDEVITTPMTFVATACAIAEAGAKPVFADVEQATGNLDPARIEAAITPRTKAILPVHLYGLMCDMKAIKEIADHYDLSIIEDAAHCVEGVRGGIRPGGLSAAACFSFYATKNLNCGEGGAIVTNDASLYERLKLLRLHGVTKSAADRAREGYTHWDMVSLGWKYNMSNIEAAILLPQMERMGRKLAERHRLADLYKKLLSPIPAIQLPSAPSGAIHARHLYTIWVGPSRRDETIAKLKENGVEVVVNYRPIHLTSYFSSLLGHRKGDFPIAERIGGSTISLPFYPHMPDEHVRQTASALAAIMNS